MIDAATPSEVQFFNSPNPDTVNKLKTVHEVGKREGPIFSVDHLLDSSDFMGSLTHGGDTVYPVWRDMLQHNYLDRMKWLICFTGAIGTGKTRTAIRGCYMEMYRLLTYKDPWNAFGLESGGRMAIVFFNLTKTLSQSRGFRLLQSYLKASPWFVKRGKLRGGKDLNDPRTWLDFPLFEFKIASPYAHGFGTVGEDVIIAIMDEVDSPGASENQRLRVLDAYDSTRRRHESRFVDPKTGESPGKFYLVASKQEKLSFLQLFVDEMKGDPSVEIVDIPLWEAKRETNYSGTKFKVMIGDAYRPSRIIHTPEEARWGLENNFSVIDIPIEYYRDFERDINGSLKDLAGVSTYELRKSKLFPSELVIEECYDEEKIHPVAHITYTTAINDNSRLIDAVDLSKIRVNRSIPRFTHTDVAYSGETGSDALGFAMSSIRGWQPTHMTDEAGNIVVQNAPIIETDFCMRIKAMEGDQIRIGMIREFHFDLRAAGFNLQKCTFDLKLLSIDTIQILSQAGMPADYLSLDKTPGGYLAFRDIVRDKRWVFCKVPYVHFELANLEYDREKNKVDHPDKVKQILVLQSGDVKETVTRGSKDLADGIAGSVYNCLTECVVPPNLEKMSEMLKKANRRFIPKKQDLDKMALDGLGRTAVGPGQKAPSDSVIQPKNANAISNKDADALSTIMRKVRGSKGSGSDIFGTMMGARKS
jgi:hypothetical protein